MSVSLGSEKSPSTIQAGDKFILVHIITVIYSYEPHFENSPFEASKNGKFTILFSIQKDAQLFMNLLAISG